MTLQQFIKTNRKELDEIIRSYPNRERIDDDERELWILNDEYLYNWARGEGVEI